MKVERESFVRFAVAVALACYALPAYLGKMKSGNDNQNQPQA